MVFISNLAYFPLPFSFQYSWFRLNPSFIGLIIIIRIHEAQNRENRTIRSRVMRAQTDVTLVYIFR